MKLLICVPTLDYMHFQFVESLTKLIMRLNDEGIPFDVKFKSGTLVYVARDCLAEEAVLGEYTHTLWLDADMIFDEDILDDLQFCGEPFVCGVYHSRRPPHCKCTFTSLDPVVRVEEYPTRAFEIAGCGMAGVLIETKIISAVRKKFGSCFCPEPNLGEDLAFCKRVAACGYKMYCEPSARMGHIGHIAIYPEDEERWNGKLIMRD